MILNKDTDCSFCPPSPFGIQTGHKTRPDDVFLWSDIPGVSWLMLESCVPCRMAGMAKRALAHRLMNSSAIL